MNRKDGSSLLPFFTLRLDLEDPDDDELIVRLRKEPEEPDEELDVRTILDDLTFFFGGLFGISKLIPKI